MDNFKLWSENNQDALKSLKPDLGIRGWSYLIPDEKEKIFTYFKNKKWFSNSAHVYYTIAKLNETYKLMSYGFNLLMHGPIHAHDQLGDRYINDCCLNAAFKDLSNIILINDENVVYEVFSFFSYNCIDSNWFNKIESTNEQNLKEEYTRKAFLKFDKFSEDFNDIFEQFSLNVMLTRNGIIFRQEDKITKEIYIPVIHYLSDIKWKEVNRDLSDAFSKFQERTPQGYSGCITHTVSALQGFLQILVHNKTGKGDIKNLIVDASKEGLIPNDSFSNKIFKDIESILMEERQKSGDPHPKKEYANEKSAILVMNIFMIFVQQCIINK